MSDYLSLSPTRACKWICYCCFFLSLQFCSRNNDRLKEISDKTEVDTLLRDNVLGSLHSSHITEQLYKSGIPSHKELLHDITSTDHYLRQSNRYIAAANLGIYLSDLTYLMESGQLEEAKRYFESCYRLSEYVGMKKQLGRAIQTGFAAILKNDTTLQTSVQSIFNNAANDAGGGEEFKKLHVTALTGYYIEELYHLVSLLQTQPALADSVKVNIIRVVADQSQELNNLIGCFDHVQMKQDGIAVYQDLLSLQAKYLALDREQVTKPVAINNERLIEIFNSVTSIRTAIINL